MSNNANSNRDDDKFFSPKGQDDKPKAPGAFTQSFMGAGNDSDAPASSDSKPPKSPTPFTAQFGSQNPFAPTPEKGVPSPVQGRIGGGKQQPAPFGGSFTKMFAPESSAENQPSGPPAEITRVFDRPAPGTASSPLPQDSRPSGFTEMFGSPPPSAPMPAPKAPAVTSTPFEPKPAGFTEFFKPQSPSAESMPATEAPLSPLSALPGTGKFTELFKGESISSGSEAAAPPTPFSRPGGGFTEFFETSSPQTASAPATTPAPVDSAPGGFTQLFKGPVGSVKPSPVSPKPAGALTQMISGGGPAPQPPAGGPSAPHAGATRLFSSAAEAPAMAPLPAGPSEYTRIVSPRQLRDLQQMTPAVNNAAPQAASQAPGAPGTPAMPTWPSLATPPVMPGVPQPPVPQMAAPQVPQAAPPWQVPQVQVQQPPPYVLQPPQAPNVPAAFPPATAPAVAPKTESKILTYLPLIIGLNVLFLIAVLFILLFALKH